MSGEGREGKREEGGGRSLRGHWEEEEEEEQTEGEAEGRGHKR